MNRSSGFTLVEMIVSLIVVGGLLAVLSSVILSGLNLAAAQDRRTTTAHDHARVAAMLRARLQAVELRASPGDARATAFEVRADRLSFVSRFPQGVGLTGSYWVDFRIQANALTIDVWNWTERGPGERLSDVVLVQDIESAAFSALSLGNVVPGLPEAVAIDLKLPGHPMRRMVFRLGVTTPTDCIIRLDTRPGGPMECAWVL